ncbi:MAG: type II CRISPR-associated endonuclease Cas1 [Proteobacteria bacterium]|nr:MAG: type II CRISPR-associated endonuclease Cas1 [Pseudomonadota bacterium]
MAWRGVHIAKPARLSFADGQIVINQDDGSIRLPLEDIACLILDTPQITVTCAMLSACAGQGVAVIVPDAKHHPAGMLLPFHQHYAQAHVAQAQVETSEPFRKRCWQAIVKAKINNQASVAAMRDATAAKALRAMAGQVGSGDPDNVEARAARAYWGALFDDFRRSDENDRRNACLNYGYAIARAALARGLVACGLLPAFGLHHRSRTNAFNLVDDLIEPLRPMIDRLVAQHAPAPSTAALSKEDRQILVGVLTETVWIEQEKLTLLAAVEKIAASLVRAIDAGSAAVLLQPALDAP